MPTFEKYERAVRLLIDTDVLIWFLRGRQSARRAIESCTTVEVSAVVYMELVQGGGTKRNYRRCAIRCG